MQEVVQLTLHEERMIQLKKQFMAVVIALLVCLGYTGAMVPATAFAAEATIGYVDLNTVFSHHPHFASARAALNLEQQKAQQEFREKAPSLDDNGKRALDNTLTERIAKREQELFNPIREKILKAVSKVAKERGLSTVLTSSAVVDGGTDITKDVLKAVGGK